MEQCQFCYNMFGDTKMLKQHQKKRSIVLKYKKNLINKNTRKRRKKKQI